MIPIHNQNSTQKTSSSWFIAFLTLATVLLGPTGIAISQDSPTDPGMAEPFPNGSQRSPSGGLSRDDEDALQQQEFEDEMRLHRAIAQSLAGNTDGAIESLAASDQDDTAILFAAAMWRMQNGELKEGVRLLEQVAERSDAPAETHKFLAVGYLHLADAKASEAAIEMYLDSNPDDSYAHYLQGMATLFQDQPDRASESLMIAGYDDREVEKIRQVAMQVPVDVAQVRNTIGNSIAAGGVLSNGGRNLSKPYNLTLLFAGEYDSNVRLQPEFSGLGSVDDLDDYRFLLASFLDIQLFSTEFVNLGLIGSTYNTFQFDIGEFNIQDYMGGAYVNSVLTHDLIGSLRYEFHHTQVDAETFANEHRLTPSLSWLGSRGHTTLFYEFNPIDARAPLLIPAQDQAGITNRIGITQAIYTHGGDGRIYLGYQFADTSADGSDFDRTAHLPNIRFEVPCSWGCIADLDLRDVWDNYDNPNSLDFLGLPREDKRLELRAGLQKNFASPVSVRLDYTYIDNDSNTENLFGVRFYDYDRHIVSTQLIFTL